MGSQFVDLNADGVVDYVTATFDGSPHVAYGVEGGFAEPERLLDKNGKRVLLDQYWDYDAEQWTNTGAGNGHCTSAVVFDWDADGDYDLLLGSYGEGNLWLQKNEGKAGEPKFSGVSEPVLAGGQPFALHGGMTAPRLVDWDGDGLTDLVCGSYGDSWTSEPPGGVYLYRNAGKAGAPEFEVATTLIAPTKTTGHDCDRPNVGLYADPVDYDGDGDLDLVVGGYSIWTPQAPELTEAQVARADELEAKIEALTEELEQAYEKLAAKAAELSKQEQGVLYSEFGQSAEQKQRQSDLELCSTELRRLRPSQERQAGVWLYRRSSS